MRINHEGHEEARRRINGALRAPLCPSWFIYYAMKRIEYGHIQSRTRQDARRLDRHGRNGPVDVPASDGEGLFGNGLYTEQGQSASAARRWCCLGRNSKSSG